MSALGQKQTFAVQNGMSALHPKADIERWLCGQHCLSKGEKLLPYGNSASGSRSGCHLQQIKVTRWQASRVRAVTFLPVVLIPFGNFYALMTSMVPSSVSTIVTMTIG